MFAISFRVISPIMFVYDYFIAGCPFLYRVNIFSALCNSRSVLASFLELLACSYPTVLLLLFILCNGKKAAQSL